MNHATTTGIICVDDSLGIQHRVAKITYTEWEDESFEYVFEPCYPVIDLLDSSIFQGIPGLALETRKAHFERKDMVPTFIEERTPGPRREDLQELLESVGMDYLNRLEWLIRTDLHYGGDHLYVRRWSEEDDIFEVDLPPFDNAPTRSVEMARWILEQIASGRNIKARDFTVDESNRSDVYHLVKSLYSREKLFRQQRQTEGIEKAKADGKYRGRKPVGIDPIVLDSIGRQFLKGGISAPDAAKKLGVSLSTFRRRMKQAFPEGKDSVC